MSNLPEALGLSISPHFCAKTQQAIGPHKDLLTIVKQTQTDVAWVCLPFIRSGQNRLVRHSEKGKKTWQTEKGGGKTTLGNEQAWPSQSPKGY